MVKPTHGPENAAGAQAVIGMLANRNSRAGKMFGNRLQSAEFKKPQPQEQLSTLFCCFVHLTNGSWGEDL